MKNASSDFFQTLYFQTLKNISTDDISLIFKQDKKNIRLFKNKKSGSILIFSKSIFNELVNKTFNIGSNIITFLKFNNDNDKYILYLGKFSTIVTEKKIKYCLKKNYNIKFDLFIFASTDKNLIFIKLFDRYSFDKLFSKKIDICDYKIYPDIANRFEFINLQLKNKDNKFKSDNDNTILNIKKDHELNNETDNNLNIKIENDELNYVNFLTKELIMKNYQIEQLRNEITKQLKSKLIDVDNFISISRYTHQDYVLEKEKNIKDEIIKQFSNALKYINNYKK
jgi:hypothetical protein